MQGARLPPGSRLTALVFLFCSKLTGQYSQRRFQKFTTSSDERNDDKSDEDARGPVASGPRDRIEPKSEFINNLSEDSTDDSDLVYENWPVSRFVNSMYQ